MSTMITNALETVAAVTAGAGALAGLATESLSPLLAGLVIAAACHALVATAHQLRRC